MQQGMLFHSLYQAEAGAYINQLHVEIGGLDVARLRMAWEQTVQAHDICAVLLWGDEQTEPLQVVQRQVPSPLQDSTGGRRPTCRPPSRRCTPSSAARRSTSGARRCCGCAWCRWRRSAM
jgi:hypothetical protein